MHRLGVEAEPVEGSWADTDRLLRSGWPMVLRLPDEGAPRFLALVHAGGRIATVVGPDLRRRRLRREDVVAALGSDPAARLVNDLEPVLERARLPMRRRDRARATIVRERLRSTPLAGGWLLRPPPGASFLTQLRSVRLPVVLVALVAAYAVHTLLWVGSWWILGTGALEGRPDHGWLVAWALMLLALVPVRAMATWCQGRLALSAGALLKRRLLAGTLAIPPDEIRHQGVGQSLGRVVESETVEALLLSGGFLGLAGAVELLFAAGVLGAGAGGVLHLGLLAAWLALTATLLRRYVHERRAWTDARLQMTHALIEQMIGHRTRLAQEPRARRHDGEDEALLGYLVRSQAMDAVATRLDGMLPRGWLLVGLAGLAPAFVAGHASAGTLAVGLGGVLLGYRALLKLTAGASQLATAGIAWKRIAPLFHAAARVEAPGLPAFALDIDGGTPEAPRRVIVRGHDLAFRYNDRPQPTLDRVTLRLRIGDRVLLIGRSGAGKSTLVSLLAGIRVPQSGLLLLDGLDRQTLGAEGWRRRVAAAPQFHENHVLAETLAFNLLMGRRWPPRAEDVRQAESVCRALGLGDLLDRMPAGLFQVVGETGWQLSHGERSRLYVARALLQGADLVILDESFAELDADTARRCLRCVLDRAPSLLVVTHGARLVAETRPREARVGRPRTR